MSREPRGNLRLFISPQYCNVLQIRIFKVLIDKPLLNKLN